MSMQHFKSLKLYTGYTTFRKEHKTETYKEAQKRNSEFAVFSRLLSESVQCYGNCMTDEIVYRGVSASFLFTKFVARFNAPSSTSTKVCSLVLYIKCFLRIMYLYIHYLEVSAFLIF